MSKYTTEVRYICETEYGAKSSVGYNDINTILENVSPKIFNFYYPIFDENYRATLEKKILKHFYTREIGAETVGLWKLWLDRKMNEIMPYYNKLYTSELMEFNPLYTHNLTRTRSGEGTTEGESTGTSTEELNGTNTKEISGTENTSSSVETNTKGTAEESISKAETKQGSSDGQESKTSGTTSETIISASKDSTTNNTNRNLYSDTPQGTIANLDNETYLTNATKDIGSTVVDEDNSSNTTIEGTENITGTNTISHTDTINATDEVNKEDERDTTETGNSTKSNAINENITNNNLTTNSSTNNTKANTTEHYLETIVGYEGKDASELLIKYRKTFLNIDLMIINELEPLFMQLW